MTLIRASASVMAALVLTGCASSMSGVGGTDRYACKAPEGALCTSVSGVYANSVHGMLQTTKGPIAIPNLAKESYGAASIAPGSAVLSAAPGSSIRSNPRVLRVWIAPWEDSDGDLHEESFIHVLVDTGRWLIEHVGPAGRSRVDGVAPPVAPVTEGSAPKGPTELPPTVGRLPASPGVSPGSIEPPIATER